MAPPTPQCPRCGYDLSGTVGTWSECCPLNGVCPECGLAFAWSRVLLLSEHPWLFEYNWRRQPLRRLARTWVMSLRPGRFWREVRLTDPVHLRPLMLIVATLIAMGLVAGFALMLRSRYRVYLAWNQPGLAPGTGPPGTRSTSDFVFQSALDLLGQVGMVYPGVLVGLVTMPLAFSLLPHTLGQAKVRPVHILRIWFYALLAPLTLLGLHAVLLAGLIAAGERNLAALIDPATAMRSVAPEKHPYIFVLGAWFPGLVAGILITAWLSYCAACGCRSYLLLRQPRRVALALAVLVLLAVLATQLWAWLLAL